MNRTTFLLSRRVRVLAAVALLSSVSWGQERKSRPEVPLAQSLHGPAMTAYSAATALFQQGDFAGAESQYQHAYDLAKEPLLLFNMAACAKNRHAYARMQSLLLRFRQEAGANISPSDKAAVDLALDAVKDMVAAIVITTNVAGAAITVDGEAVGTTPLTQPFVVDFGRHTVAARKDGFEDVEQSIEAAGPSAAAREVSLVLQEQSALLVVVAEPGAAIAVDGRSAANGRLETRLSVGAHNVEVTAPGKVSYRTEVDLRDRETRTLQVALRESESSANGRAAPWRPIAQWSLLGGGGVIAGVGVALMILEAGNANEANRAHDKGTYDSALTAWNIGLAASIVGGAAIACGGILMALPGGTGSARASRGSLQVRLDARELSVAGTW
jgi:hypothetical protein